jgi:hypothetical protein
MKHKANQHLRQERSLKSQRKRREEEVRRANIPCLDAGIPQDKFFREGVLIYVRHTTIMKGICMWKAGLPYRLAFV